MLDGMLSLTSVYIRSVLDKSNIGDATSVATPSKAASTARTQLEEKQVHTDSHRDYRTLAGLRQCVSEIRYDATCATKEGDAIHLEPNGGECVQEANRIARFLKRRPRCLLSCPLVNTENVES